MRILFYVLWALSSLLIGLAVLFNHYAEFQLDSPAIDLLFNDYTRQWAYLNAGITMVWLLLTVVVMFMISRGKLTCTK